MELAKIKVENEKKEKEIIENEICDLKNQSR